MRRGLLAVPAEGAGSSVCSKFIINVNCITATNCAWKQRALRCCQSSAVIPDVPVPNGTQIARC